MIRTIIADDDFLVRSYLKQLNSWKNADFQIVAEARDGEEALKMIEEYGPEVIVTDISMPLIDGIDMIRTLREKNSSIYIIVLSCHDDFDYVKEAMRLGADEYVLKNSLNEESLYTMLVNTRMQLCGRETKYKESDEARKLMEMGRHTLKYYFFNGLLAGSFSSSEREEQRKEAGILASFMNSAVINMFIPNWGELKNDISEIDMEQYGQRFLQKLLGELKQREADADYLECVYLGEGVFCCFIDVSKLRRISLMKQRLTGIATACYHFCKQEKYHFDVGVSNICFGEEGIRQAYQQARKMIKLSFYIEDSILYYEGSPEIGKVLPKQASELLDNVDALKKQRDYVGFKKRFGEVIEESKRQYTDKRVILHWLKELEQKIDITRTSDIYSGIVKIQQLEAICEGEYQKIFSQNLKQIPEGTSKSIKLVLAYIHLHFKEEIGLTEAAEKAGLNAAYLSYLFKQEVGIGFSNYLLELRMECARNLLTSTNDKVKNVAAAAGFHDYHYFSKAFKKIQGISPVDYRKQNI